VGGQLSVSPIPLAGADEQKKGGTARVPATPALHRSPILFRRPHHRGEENSPPPGPSKFFIHLRGSSTSPSRTSATAKRVSKLISKSILPIVPGSSFSPSAGMAGRWAGEAQGPFSLKILVLKWRPTRLITLDEEDESPGDGERGSGRERRTRRAGGGRGRGGEGERMTMRGGGGAGGAGDPSGHPESRIRRARLPITRESARGETGRSVASI